MSITANKKRHPGRTGGKNEPDKKFNEQIVGKINDIIPNPFGDLLNTKMQI